MSDFFTVNQLAEYLNANPKTVYRRLRAKGIPAHKVEKCWRNAKKDIKWLKRRCFKNKVSDLFAP